MLAPVSVCVPPVSVSPPLPEMMPENRSFFASVIVRFFVPSVTAPLPARLWMLGGARSQLPEMLKVPFATTRLDVAIEPLLVSASVPAWITVSPM